MNNHKCGCNCKCKCNSKSNKNCSNDFILKFSGMSGTSSSGILSSFLADPGIGVGLLPLTAAINYPVDLKTTFKSLTVNLPQVAVPPGATLTVNLLKDGTLVPNASISYGGINPNTGIQTLLFGTPIVYQLGNRFDLQVVITGSVTLPISVSATIRASI